MAPQSRGDSTSSAQQNNKNGSKAQQANTSYQGYLAGTASGLTKLVVGHPFDSVKVRMQCSPPGTYSGPWHAFRSLVKNESVLSLYKGASPPAVGWAITDAVLLGSLHQYRVIFARWSGTGEGTGKPLPLQYHGLAGLLAGWTNSFVTSPIELLKTKLQMQTQRVSLHLPGRGASASVGTAATAPQFKGPIDCAAQIVRAHGVLGMWHALPATLLFRSSFAVMWVSYDIIQRGFTQLRGTPFEMSTGVQTFLAGGLGAEFYWLTALPADNIKNRMMGDDLYKPKYPTMKSCAIAIWNEPGPKASTVARIRNFYTGLAPCLLRAFPTNAAAILAFETTMRFLGAENTAVH
ncbi:unnamed protein product [Tilletia laevis]|uniref:Mitochondrial carrier n=2 Tax=Tilletia TaxID=13289 RepID=A0A177VF84_9BASI|nr:hypothetical protein CF336_g4954 [Tilletia laevis]KAE8258981.1 hypothetical protein A4X03_0g4225 [Tilletia caries]KAE8198045.1 hypothetical protein CF335_g4471 [Tilletia laevis]CAD6886611.1 unnamed protein product [Tilletia caries]CAD6900343.1 unnamed protein product [Tilletia caries]